jgi:hypothetical protein
MKIKGSSVAAIGIGAFLTGVAAGVAACRKDALRAAGQFFGGVVGGAGAVAVAVATSETRTAAREERRERQELILQYLRLKEAQANAAAMTAFWLGLNVDERQYVRSRVGL